MPEENQPPKRPYQSFKRHFADPVPPETKEAMKADWLTGQYTTVQLEEKYKIERSRIIAFMRFQWTREAKRLGVVPPKEPTLPRRSYGRGTWNKARLDFLSGKSYEEIGNKYGIPEQHVQFMSYRRGWTLERDKMFSDGKRLLEATIQSNSAALAVRYDGWARAVMEQIDEMTNRLKSMVQEGTCTPERLKIMIDSLGGIINMGMKIYGMEKSQTQVNNQFIRLNVLDESAAATMNQLAKTINLKTA